MVVLLLLLSVPFLSGVGENDEIDSRASSDSLESRWYEFRFPFRDAVGRKLEGGSSASASLSSSIVGSTAAWGALFANSSSFPHLSC